jgi:hypothetical protein
MRVEVEALFARFKKTKPTAASQSLAATAPTGAAATRHSLPVTRHRTEGAFPRHSILQPCPTPPFALKMYPMQIAHR